MSLDREPMPRKPRNNSPLELSLKTIICKPRGVQEPVELVNQIALDRKYTRNRQDAFSIQETKDGFLTRVSSVLPHDSLRFLFGKNNYSITLYGNVDEFTFVDNEARLALTTEFYTDGKKILSPVHLYRSLVHVRPFSYADDRQFKPGDFSGNPVLPLDIAELLRAATGKKTVREANGALLGAYGRIMGQYLFKKSAAAPYVQTDHTFDATPGDFPMTHANGALHYDTSAVTLEQVNRLMEQSGPINMQTMNMFLACVQRKAEPEQRQQRREIHDRRSYHRQIYR